MERSVSPFERALYAFGAISGNNIVTIGRVEGPLSDATLRRALKRLQRMHPLLSVHIETDQDAPLNTETPGSVIDRLSILSLRIFHLEEQVQRSDATTEHVESVQQKIAVCLLQHHDLSMSLSLLLDDISTGRKRHKTYRQFKMYNDPTLNPYLYQAKQRLAG